MASDQTAPVDLLIYGATGYTGKCAALELAHQLSSQPSLQWAIGGRSAASLAKVRDEVVLSFPQAPAPSLVVADAETGSREELSSAFGRAKVVVNCAGPFQRFGLHIVRACVDAKISGYVDISGEPSFILGAMLEEDARAREAGTLVVSACGFDSIPAEIGALFTAQALAESVSTLPPADGVETTHITSFIKMDGTGAKGPLVNVTTLECALIGMRTVDETRRIRRAVDAKNKTIDPAAADRPKPPKPRTGIFKDVRASPDGGANGVPFCTMFPGSDAAIARQTISAFQAGRSFAPQSSHYHSYSTYLVIGGALSTCVMVLCALLIGIVNFIPGGNRLILRYPQLFTAGLFSPAGPSLEDRQRTVVTLDFFGTRYTKKEERANAVTRVSVRDPGYGATVRMLLACAMTMLKERPSMPDGGVLTPAATFGGTSLVQRLRDTKALQLDVLHTSTS